MSDEDVERAVNSIKAALEKNAPEAVVIEVPAEDIPPALMAMLQDIVYPRESDPIIEAVLEEFKALDIADIGPRTQEIVGSDSYGIPNGLAQILHTFLPYSSTATVDIEVIDAEASGRYAAMITCFVAGFQFAKKNGAAPVEETVAV